LFFERREAGQCAQLAERDELDERVGEQFVGSGDAFLIGCDGLAVAAASASS
jgi:hypothetical protein